MDEKEIKKQLYKLEEKYNKDKEAILKKCKHNWIENGYESNKYNGTQYYKCSICGAKKGVGF